MPSTPPAPATTAAAAVTTPKLSNAQLELSRRTAQSNLRAAESLASTVYTNSGRQWTATIGTDLAGIDRSITWNAPTSAGSTQVGFATSGDPVLVLAVRSAGGHCYFTKIDNSVPGGTHYSATHSSSATCDASAPKWDAATDATTVEAGWA